MIRNSILYHRLWYVKKRNLKKVHIYFRILVILIIFALLVFYSEIKLVPYVADISENNARNIIEKSLNEEIKNRFAGELEYNHLVTIDRGSDNQIISIQTDVALLDNIASNIGEDLRQELVSSGKDSIIVPFGVLFGRNTLTGVSPGIRMKVNTYRNIDVNFKSEFIDAGGNRTKHSIILETKAEVYIGMPFIEKKSEISLNTPIVETVITGRLPEGNSYIR